MKVCTRCGVDKSLDNFHQNGFLKYTEIVNEYSFVRY